jgi:hypothetical protein
VISWLKRLLGQHPLSDEALSAYVDGRSPPAANVEAHLTLCEPCRAKVSELLAVKSMLAELPQVRPARSFALTPEMAARPASPSPSPVKRGRLIWAPAAALTALVLLLGVDLALIGGGDEGSSRGAADSAATKDEAAESAAFSSPAAPDTALRSAEPPAAQGTPAAGAAGGAQGEVAPAAAPQPSPVEPQTMQRQAEEAQTPQPSEDRDAPAALEADGSDPERAIVRILEVVAALSLAGSLVYVWYRLRRPASSDR